MQDISTEEDNDRIRKTDITLVLRPIGGKPKDVTGIVDHSLFKGINNLHAILDQQTCLWKLAYDNGMLPGGLKGHTFTGFNKLLQHVTTYFKARNVEVVEIRD